MAIIRNPPAPEFNSFSAAMLAASERERNDAIDMGIPAVIRGLIGSLLALEFTRHFSDVAKIVREGAAGSDLSPEVLAAVDDYLRQQSGGEFLENLWAREFEIMGDAGARARLTNEIAAEFFAHHCAENSRGLRAAWDSLHAKYLASAADAR